MIRLSFECNRCGECCSHLGLVNIIKEDHGDYHFLICNQYTGEKTEVAIDPDKIPLFLNKSLLPRCPEVCPFYRVEPVSGNTYCTIHLTRPEMCRDFGCWRLLILDSTGKRAGRVMGSRYLASEDEVLTRLFEDIINNLAEYDDEVWDQHVTLELARAGYIVRT